jgi:hypothetical protein
MAQDKPTYRMEGGRTPWGDYGRILMQGMSAHLGRDASGAIQLERTGPFVPPISFPGIGDVIVTDALKKELEASGLSGFSFRAVRLARIVKLDWQLWDMKAKAPKEYPSEGEPEGYILDRKHSPELAGKMAPLWEMVLQPGGREVRVQKGAHTWEVDIFIESGSLKGLDLFRADSTSYNYISEKAKDWLEKHAREYVSFQQCEFRPKPQPKG